jgi:ABC-type amino acid transport substrate-binding protein
MKNILVSIFLLLALLISLCSCGSGVPGNSVFSESDLSNRNVGVISGSIAAGSTKLHGYTNSVTGYENEEVLLKALESGDIDCAVLDYNFADALQKKSAKVKMLDEPFIDESYCFIAAKENITLTEDINSALSQLIENGTLEAIIEGYTNQSDFKYESVLTETDGSISILADTSNMPYVIETESGSTGLDIDIAVAVCDILGIGLEIIPMNETDDPIEIVKNGGADIAMGLVFNESDAQKVDFSDSYFTSTQMILVRK